jgi:hypothetical protein
MRFADQPKRYALCRARLTKRRVAVVRTLDYLAAERRQVDTNRRWSSSSTQRRRRDLLAKVHGWYAAELMKIDRVLARLSEAPLGG